MNFIWKRDEAGHLIIEWPDTGERRPATPVETVLIERLTAALSSV